MYLKGNLYVIVIFYITPIVAGFASIFISILFGTYEKSGLYLSILSYLAGLIALIYSKRKNLKNKKFFEFGPYSLDSFDKKIYYLGYFLIFFSLYSLSYWVAMIKDKL